MEGHSDADVVLHAITDSILGIVKEGDIGRVFSNKNLKWKNADSKIFLDYAIGRVKQLNYIIRYIDITIICEEPKISPHANRMIKKISELVEISVDNISIKDRIIVIDEVVGQLIAMIFAKDNFGLIILSFILFRIFDIFKPWPASYADSKIDGGLGVMLDDVFAGIYAAIIIFIFKGFII